MAMVCEFAAPSLQAEIMCLLNGGTIVSMGFVEAAPMPWIRGEDCYDLLK